MEEHDPTAVDPDDVAPPSEPVEDQTPPPGFEPQVDAGPEQNPGVTERLTDAVPEAEAEEAAADPSRGAADDGDDDSEDGDGETPATTD